MTDATNTLQRKMVSVIIAELRVRLVLRGVVFQTMRIEVWLRAQTNLVLIHVLSSGRITHA